jgi:hypothetical protein
LELRVIPGLLFTSLIMMAPTNVDAQTAITVEVGASQVGPPIGGDGDISRFAVGGLRASHFAVTGSGISASVLAGRAFGDPGGGDFFSATLASSMVENWGRGWTGGMDLTLLGFGIRAPYPYRALAAEGGPVVHYQRGGFSLKGAAVAGVGRSRIELWRVSGGATRTFADDLWRVGGLAEVMLGSGALRVGLTGGAHDTRGGAFTSGGGRVLVAGTWGAIQLAADVWSTPLGSEATGGLTFHIPMSGWSVRGFAGRSEPDPLTLAEPGSGSGGLLLGRSLFSRPLGGMVEANGRGPDVLTPTTAGARVRMSLEAPGAAGTVEVMGDFTLWEAVPMHRVGDEWIAELDVEAGTHHYGYMIDGVWYVPEGEPLVEDEWGRANAILVIEMEGEN